MQPTRGLEPHELEPARAAAQAHGVSLPLLDELVRIERDPVGRKGSSGVGFQVQEAIRRPPTHALDPTDDAPSRDSLRIRWVEFRNFALFREARLELEHQPNRPLHLVEGLNGHGKSTLIKALRFVLFGATKRQLAELVSVSTPGPTADLKVALCLHSRQLGEIKITRVASCQLDAEGWKVRDIDVIVGVGGEQLHDQEARTWLGGVFPEKILSYFIFDAERSPINELAQRRRAEGSVRQHVEEVLGVATLRRLARRCRTAGSVFRGEAPEEEPTPERLEAELTALRAREGELNTSLTEARGRLDVLQRQQDRLRSELDEPRDPRGDEARQQREALLAERFALERDLEEGRSQLHRWLGHSLPLLLLGELPPDSGLTASREWLTGARYSVDRLAQLIDGGEVAWVRAEWSGQAVREDLSRRLGLHQARLTDSKVTEARTRLEMASQRARRHSLPPTPERLEAMNSRLRAIGAELDALQPPTPAPRESSGAQDTLHQLEALWAEAHQLEDRIHQLEAELLESEEQIEAIETQLPRARQARSARDKASALHTRASSCADALEALADEVARARVQSLQAATTRLLRRITNKPEYFDRLVFDEQSLRYRLLDPQGEEVPPERSTGERAVLALALIHGLQEVSTRSFPVVVEAPLKPLDAQHTSKVMVNFFADARTQTLLLVKPGELGEHSALIGQVISTEHVLHRPEPSVEASVFLPRR